MRRRAKPAKAKGPGRAPAARTSPGTTTARVRDLETRLAEALEQQTAAADILRVIASSPRDAQPVFDAIAERAITLCGAGGSGVLRFDGELVHLVALRNMDPAGAVTLRSAYPMAPSPGSAGTRAILTGALVHIPDVLDDPEYEMATQARAAGFRSILSVPMLHADRVIGAVNVVRAEPGGFSESQVALLRTFADQAVIAIENVRLFGELDERNVALAIVNAQLIEALGRQTATGEILRVIARSPTDVQPVFDTIVRNAVLLCGGMYGSVVRYDGELMHLAAGYNHAPGVDRALREAFPMRPSSRMMSGRAGRRLPQHARRAHAARWGPHRGDRGQSRAARSLLAEPGRAAADLRRPGRYRGRERPAVPGARGPDA